MTHQEDLPQVLAIVHELLRAAEGHPITVSTLDGTQVCLRLPTADELAEKIRAAQAMLADPPEFPSRRRIEELAAPLRLP